jgi:AhpD family alkylhydroperoxidase
MSEGRARGTPRLAYPDSTSPELRELTAEIVSRRGRLLELYQMLLHSPPIARGWLELMTAVRRRTQLPGALRELVIIRIGWLNGASYEVAEHTPIARAEGASTAQIEAMSDWEKRRSLFSETEAIALGMTDQITHQCSLDDEMWRRARAQWSDQELVEIIATISAYNMVSRFLRVLQLE